jgi:hypothetical protein
MIRRIAIAGACAAVVLMLVPTPAMAKGLTSMTVTGPGLPAPIKLGMEGSNQFWPASGVGAETAVEALGPKYSADGKLGFEGRGFTDVHLDLYPLALGGPRVYGPPGQKWPGKNGESLPTGWWQPQAGLIDFLIRGGLGLGAAEITGPKLASPIQMTSGGTSGYAYLTDLYRVIGENSFGKPAWTSLGPRYVATLHPPGGGVLTQYLYPYARNATVADPLVYTPRGQHWMGAPLQPGWGLGSTSLLGELRDNGLPPLAPPVGTAFPAWAFLAGLGALALLVAAGATVERRRSRRTAPGIGITT